MALPSLKIGRVSIAKAIVQQGMAILVSLWDIVSAVINKGGVGTIGASGLTPKELRDQIKKVRENTRKGARGALAVNIMKAMKKRRFYNLVKVCIDENVDILFVGAGLIDHELWNYCKGRIELVPIVSRPSFLKMLERMGIKPVAIVIEAGLAGGHLGPKFPDSIEAGWRALLVEFKKALKLMDWDDVPVIIAGGLLTAEDVNEAFALGAAGVGMGYRFAMTFDARPRLAPWQDVMLGLTDAIVTGGKDSPGSPTGFHSRMGLNLLVQTLLEQGYVHLGKAECKYNCLESCIYRDGNPAKGISPFTKSFCINKALRLALEGSDWGLYFPSGRFKEVTGYVWAGDYIDYLDGRHEMPEQIAA